MNDLDDAAVTRALDPYAHELRLARPSAYLDARIEATIDSWAAESSARKFVQRPLRWIVAAASVAIIAGGIALLMRREESRAADVAQPAELQNPPRLLLSAAAVPRADANSPETVYRSTNASTPDAGTPEVSALAAGQMSLWPAESAIFRVKASLASMTGATAGEERHDRPRQYWVDVRIANDGTMRIMQVLPADRGRPTPLN